MQNMKFFKHVIRLVVLLSVAGLTQASAMAGRAGDKIGQPDLPAACTNIDVPEGNEFGFRLYALGVQIYRWNGATWDFVAPDAKLFADVNYRVKIGTHYAGPTWEGPGSLVVGARVDGCSVDSSAIDWLLIRSVSNVGRGIFGGVTFIQRVNTAGGKAPCAPGAFVGAEARVPYTTEYYFYRSAD